MTPHDTRPRPTARAVVGLASLALLCSAVPGSASAAPAVDGPEPGGAVPAARPNVVFVLADDLGYDDLSTDAFGPGSRVIETPALDRMASGGTVATSAYSSPSCSPTRMALLTGLAAPRPQNNSYQVGDLTQKRTPLVGARQGQGPQGRVQLRGSTRTVAETARAAGYRTGYIGKFHATATAAAITRQHGFGVNVGGTPAGAPRSYHATGGTFDRNVGPGLDEHAAPYTQRYVDTQIEPFSRGVPQADLDALVGTRKHVTDAVGDAMLDLVGVGDRPTFTFVGQYAVHSPVEPREARLDLRRKYAGADGLTGYAGLVEGLDQTMARLRRHLETTPDPRRPGEVLADNTVVIFTSDNGGRTQKGASNAPYRGQKFELREGGVRVPFIAWSGNPDLVRRGGVIDRVVQNEDLHPTVAAFARTRPPRSVRDGLSLVPALAGRRALRNREHVVHLPGYFINGGREQRPETTLRKNDWKLAYRYEDRSFVLRNVVLNPRETRDYTATRRTIATDLGNRMIRWLDRMGPDLARLRGTRERYSFVVPARTKIYRGGRVVVARTARSVTVDPGEEAPFVLCPRLDCRRR